MRVIKMITINKSIQSEILITTMEEIVPQDSLFRKIDKYIDFTFIYDEVKDLYGFDTAAIVDMNEVVECLYNKEVKGEVLIDDTLKAAIDAYYAEYGA